MTLSRTRVLVTGADQHQGLAVIRGLGMAGVDVIAAGAEKHSMGFYSKYVVERVHYRHPREDPDGFVDDILAALRRTGADLVMPAVESTLAALVARRQEIEQWAPLAAPATATVAYALDKRSMIELAMASGVPIPQSADGASMEALLAHARRLRPPYVIKPRGHDSSMAIPGGRDFKVRYAANREELRRVLLPLADQADKLLVQEYIPGIGRCVASVWRHGRPVTLFAYEREREFPLSGGVSVVRRSIPVEHELSLLTVRLLSTIGWHGVAMVEFKYDRRTKRYTLMEINGRFQASTALCIDAGINLPSIAMAVHLDRATDVVPLYRHNVVERWLRGDVAALLGTLRRDDFDGVGIVGRLVAFASALWPFVRDFGRTTRYDEFRLADPKPGFVEAWSMLKEAARATASAIVRVMRPSRKSAEPEAAVPTPVLATRETSDDEPVVAAASHAGTRIPASVAAQRSMRV
jgi:predicted ATP-grasp superfamily ATP-dependent carboligase